MHSIAHQFDSKVLKNSNFQLNMVPRCANWESLNSSQSTGHATRGKKGLTLESDIMLYQFKRNIINPTFNGTAIQTIRCPTS